MPAISTQLSVNPASGTKTTDGTEQTLCQSTNLPIGSTFQLVIDTSAMADGDAIELRRYRGFNGGAFQLAGFATFGNVQTDAMKESLPGFMETGGQIKYTIKRVAGTDRAYPWAVVQS